MSNLQDLRFVDLVLGTDFCEAKVEGPELTKMIDVQGSHGPDVNAIRARCLEEHLKAPEFTLQHEGLRFRVTTMNLEDKAVWFLSRIDAQVRPLADLPVPKDFVDFIIRPKLQGLILVTGGFGTGKTTTAASLFCHRISQLGGLGIALEDPAGEVRMAGRCGHGRVVQVPVSAQTGGYHPPLQRVRRSRADFVLIGEIRESRTAIEAQDIANTDMPVIATMHASSVEEALDKYQTYLRADNASSAEANAKLAMTLAGVIHLTKEYTRTATNESVARYTPRCLLVDRHNPASSGIIGKIRDGNFIGLNDDIAFQASRRVRGF